MRRQKRRAPYTLTIDNLSHEGRGVGRHNGKTVFVRGALPGEEVVAQTLRRRGSFDEAVALEILTASPQRIEPPCPHADVCGGCSLQHLSTEDQVVHKESVLFELLRHQAGIEPVNRLPALRGPTWGYRRKARLGVKYVEKKGGALVGFREKAAPYIADIAACGVLIPAVGEHLLALRGLINGLSNPHRIPQIEVAAGDDDVALVLRHLEPLNDADLARLTDFQTDTGLGIFLQPGGEDSVHALNDATPALSYRIGDIGIAFAPTDFTQVNGAMNLNMIATVIDALQPGTDDRVLDLYAGLGNFSLPLARHAQHVHGIEGSDDLVARARDNAAANGITNTSFAVADLADPEAVERIDLSKTTMMLLDPPRTGADVIVERLKLDGLKRIVYVSCNPVTLARDTKAIVERHGFTLAAAGIMDMFPHTSHVESIAIFNPT
ncbi:MAG: 23S rRNA (uracil(1939)-C(5))-methyltransferase RlmD [Gammaproteobacteria bacterium]|jgi:23S rRNA (uracil1939-C5)-methyltransferase